MNDDNLLWLRDLAEAYQDAMYLDHIIEGASERPNVQKASSTHVSRAAHRLAKAAVEILVRATES